MENFMKNPSNKTSFPPIIDSSMLSLFASCPQKFKIYHIDNLVPKNDSIDLLWGRCFAEGCNQTRRSFYLSKNSPETAILHGVNAILKNWTPSILGNLKYKTLASCIDALKRYFDFNSLENPDLVPLPGEPFEHIFALDLEIPHPDNPENSICFGGRFDMIANLNGQTWIFDEKSTQSYDLTKWAKSMHFRAQYIAYSFASECFHRPVLGVITKGILLQNETKFLDIISPISPALKNEWREGLKILISQMIQNYKENSWPKIGLFSGSCYQYSVCSLHSLCQLGCPVDPENLEDFQENTFWKSFLERSTL